MNPHKTYVVTLDGTTLCLDNVLSVYEKNGLLYFSRDVNATPTTIDNHVLACVPIAQLKCFYGEDCV